VTLLVLLLSFLLFGRNAVEGCWKAQQEDDDAKKKAAATDDEKRIL